MTARLAHRARWRGGRALLPAVLIAVTASAASAQTWNARATGDFGATAFSAADSFDAIFGSPTGIVFGGGAEVVTPRRIFAGVRVSRFQKDGHRVFVFEGETFDLDIDAQVRIIPIELTGGYRFGRPASRVVPYAGGGVGWHRLQETSEGASGDEDVSETHFGYHALGGAEFRASRYIGIAGEVQWTSVPDALGSDPNSVAAAFDETNLGGASFRVKLVIGR